ncbi:MAG TPA: prepilin-type N-terminal cleavage/methylation domain-containing protein [Candidatus Paceibacterota bacterium]|nr:prepilin-type N-terminal cleavage/methylation domain-containing protein [Candidatus Paceibacterota bacterium]HRZ34524.1 prepilin-type N-terminal cleavage/methylation domain-containing protein [Candidatus Paceibacterota bacterium]
MKSYGFTLIEILITIGIVLVIAALALPISIDFYNNQITRSATDEIFSALKKAQAFSLYRRDDSSYGVAFDSGEDVYVIFDGDYNDVPADYDEVYDLQSISVSFDPEADPVNEISFEKGTGLPNEGSITTITLTKGAVEQFISVCESGLVELGENCDEI